MKIPISAVIAFILSIGMSLQAQPPALPPAQQTSQPLGAPPTPAQQTSQPLGAPLTPAVVDQHSETQADRFPDLRENATQLRLAFEDLNSTSQKDIDRLMLTKRCQIMRIGPDLDRMIAAMKQWLDAEKRYWQVWNEAETKRVEGERNTLAGMQEDQKSVAVQIEDEKKNQEALERSRADLENSKRTEEIKAEMDRLLKDIQDSQARLDHAREQYNSLSVSITDYQSLLNTRIVNIRQNIQRLDAYEVDQNATYESERKAAQEVCNMKQPSSPTPLPKSGGK